MADQTNDIADLIIRLRADVSDLKATMEAGKGIVQEQTDSMKESFGELKKEIAEVFAAEKIKEFFMEGLKNFAEFDKQLSMTQFNLQRYGQATAESKEQMAQWADEIQRTTLFTKTEAVTTLNKLVTMTHSLTDSLKLSKLAMDVSAGTGLELTQITRGLGNAFEGNNHALGRLLINFPELKQQIDAGGDAVALLQSQFGGFSAKIGQDGLAGQIFHLKVAWDELAEDFVKQNKESVSSTIDGMMTFVHWVASAIDFVTKLAESVGAFLGHVAGEMIAFKDLLTGHVAEFKGEMKALALANKEASDQIWGDQQEAVKKFSATMTDGALHAKKIVEDATQVTVDSVQKIYAQATLKATLTWTQIQALYSEGNRVLTQQANEADDAFKKRVEETKKAHEAAAKDIESMSKTAAAETSKAFETSAKDMTKAYLAGTLTIKGAFEILGKAIFKSIVQAIGKALIQESVADYGKAIAAALSYDYAGAAGFAAAGAELDAVGGGIIGVAEAALAEGGYVNQPTIALLGEAGPEKVTPLSGGHPLDNGGGVHVEKMEFNYHGVKDAKEAMGSGQVRRAGHDILTQLDLERRRQGQRPQRGG